MSTPPVLVLPPLSSQLHMGNANFPKVEGNGPPLYERFEAFLCKKEIANANTELNNPFDQRLRLE